MAGTPDLKNLSIKSWGNEAEIFIIAISGWGK